MSSLASSRRKADGLASFVLLFVFLSSIEVGLHFPVILGRRVAGWREDLFFVTEIAASVSAYVAPLRKDDGRSVHTLHHLVMALRR